MLLTGLGVLTETRGKKRYLEGNPQTCSQGRCVGVFRSHVVNVVLVIFAGLEGLESVGRLPFSDCQKSRYATVLPDRKSVV